MNWAWWLPGTPGIPPAAGMFVTMMEYRQPVARLKGSQVPGLAARRHGAAHDPPQPGGPSGGPAQQMGDLGDVLVCAGGVFLADAAEVFDRRAVVAAAGPVVARTGLTPRQRGVAVTASIVSGEAAEVDAVDDAGGVHGELLVVEAGYRAGGQA